MNNEQGLSGDKSLEIIHRMINNAKSNITDDGIGWLIWGSMIFLASVTTYILMEINHRMIFMGWNIFGIIAVLLLLYDFVIKKKNNKVRTYVEDLLRLFDIGFT